MTAEPEFWNNLAEKYSRRPVDLPDAFERKIEITMSGIAPSDQILDIGCGTGSLALRLASSGAQIHGLDFSDEMIRIAREKLTAQSAPNVTFHTGPFDESFTLFDSETLDGLCAYSLLHLVEDRTATLAQIYRLLKPGGFFISSTACLGDTWVPYSPIIKLMRWLGKAPPVSIIGRQTLEDDIRRAGFIDLESPDVGATQTTAFIVAAKPQGSSREGNNGS